MPALSQVTSAAAAPVRGTAWRTFAEADQFAAAIAGAQLTITPKQRSTGAWALLPLALERGFVQFADEPCATLTHGTIARDIAGFGVALTAGDGYRMSGHPIAGHVFAMFGPGAPHFASSTSPTRWAAVSFAPADLASALGALRGGDALPLRTVFRPVFASTEAATTVVNLLFSALRSVENDGSAFAMSAARSSLEHALLDAFAQAVTSAEEPPRADRVKLPATRLVRQCEEYLETHLATPVYIADLCKLTAASERTLRNAFHTVYGIGPTRYLMQRRLANARRALRESAAGDTVTSIATRHGLWDLGRFAADYRALYGEPPSATLRAARGGAMAA
jgi:AraC family ethanolamine operon transcriptional activator